MKVSKKSGGAAALAVAQLAMMAGIACAAAPLVPDDVMMGAIGGAAVMAASAISSRASAIVAQPPSIEDEDEFINKLSLVVRKPQEGKTFICISNITGDKTRNVHIVLTMNALASNMQYFGRMENEIGSKRIIVFNSDKSTAGSCLHAQNVGEIILLLRKNPDVKVIVCCAHEKRIRKSIPDLFDQAADSKSFENRKFAIHIDEAHAYISGKNREYVRKYNASPIVVKITGYSATSKPIFTKIRDDPLFYKIHIINVEEELEIIRSPEYFGVKDCDIRVYDYIVPDDVVRDAALDTTISPIVYERAKSENTSTKWYGEKYYFDLGNEILYLSFLKFILPKLRIALDKFSYHFVPAYTRKVTHYQTIELLLQEVPTANVIVLNGNGMELFRMNDDGTNSICVINGEQVMQQAKSEKDKRKLLEPSYMIQTMIEPFPNCPTFVTGYTCVGMSVTLINETIGNFDNVVMAHHHLNEDKLYQLCRFLFNPVSWSQAGKDRIKKTRFHSMTTKVKETCLQYEAYVMRLSTDFAGKCPSLREIDGSEPELPTDRERRTQALASIRMATPPELKKLKVWDGNDEEMWAKADEIYKSVMGKKMSRNVDPRNKKDEAGFYQCSTTKVLKRESHEAIKKIADYSWWSIHALCAGQTEYARVFVGYDNLDDNTEYTIYIKTVRLERSERTLAVLAEYSKKKSPKAVVGEETALSSDATTTSVDDSSDDEE
jgi:bacterioferritin (cytochrome b1)